MQEFAIFHNVFLLFPNSFAQILEIFSHIYDHTFYIINKLIIVQDYYGKFNYVYDIKDPFYISPKLNTFFYIISMVKTLSQTIFIMLRDF